MSKVHEIVRDKILAELDKGHAPWVKPWIITRPFNADSGRAYTSINALLLMCSGRGPGFITVKKACELHADWKGVSPEIVTFYAKVQASKEKKKAAGLPEDADSGFMLLRYYDVLPVAEVRGLPQKYYDANVIKTGDAATQNFVPAAEAVINGTDAHIVFGCNKASYAPGMDVINMPHKDTFTSIEEYYCTLFHELVHWTMHASRLDRKANESYASEELIAEIGAAVLLGSVGIDYEKVITNIGAYCGGWAKKIREADKAGLIVTAASKAFKAVDFIMAGTPEPEEGTE